MFIFKGFSWFMCRQICKHSFYFVPLHCLPRVGGGPLGLPPFCKIMSVFNLILCFCVCLLTFVARSLFNVKICPLNYLGHR